MKWNKHVLRGLIFIGIVAAICLFSGFLLNCFFANNFSFVFDAQLFLGRETYLYAGLFCVIFILIWMSYYYKHYWLKNSKKIIQGDQRDNDVKANLESAHFQTDKEVDKNFTRIEYAELDKKELSGIPVKALQKKNKYEINFARNAHTMIIGTTESGKTTAFINPAVQILSQSAAKASMLISDPKGEIYVLHAKTLQNKGYQVKILDLRNPFHSVRRNPLERPYKMYQRMLNLDSKVIADQEKGCFVWNKNSYFKPEDLHGALQVEKHFTDRRVRKSPSK